MRPVLAGLVLLALCATEATAQRNCKKGIPCGGSCISATKTCRIGSSQPAPRPPTDAEPAQVRTLREAIAERTLRESLTVAESLPIDATASLARVKFVADAQGSRYFPIGCDLAARIPVQRRVYFQSAEAAEILRFNASPLCP